MIPELQDDDHLDRLVHAGVATRRLAEMLAQFRSQLLEEGFTPEGAERLSETLMGALIFNE